MSFTGSSFRLRLRGTCYFIGGDIARKIHTPSDFVVDQEASDAESGVYREILLLDNVWTMFCRRIRDPITSIISTA